MKKFLINSNQFIFADAPEPWQWNFQDSATPVAEGMIAFHDNVMFYLTFIIVGVLWMIISILQVFRDDVRKIPLKYTSHGPTIEVGWTLAPALILMMIAYPSFKLLYLLDEVTDPVITIKITGHQWYWTVEYTDYISVSHLSKLVNVVKFDSYLKPTDDLVKGELRLLETDRRVVLPIDTHIRVVVTGADVIHAWAVPSLGVKVDAVPGRLNQVSILMKRPGVYYGQCSEICGVQHAFMPIALEAVELDKYLAFITECLKESASENQVNPVSPHIEPTSPKEKIYIDAITKAFAEQYGINDLSIFAFLDSKIFKDISKKK